MRQTLVTESRYPRLTASFGLLLSLIAIALIALSWIVRHLLAQRRARVLGELLDQIDELERVLGECRHRMGAVTRVVHRTPADINQSALASLDADSKLRLAFRDILEHRLWIQRHGRAARLRELDAALAAVRRSREQLSAQLGRLAAAGAALEAACDASDALAAPPTAGSGRLSLRRSGG